MTTIVPGDVVEVEIEGVDILRNPVMQKRLEEMSDHVLKLGWTLLLMAAALGCGGSGGDGMSEDDNLLGAGATIGDSHVDTEAAAPVEYSGWRPAVTSTWQWQLVGTINTDYDVDVYDIDLFDVPQATIDQLHADERKVMCYFSGGSFEEWREDADDFANDSLGKSLDGWEGERWLDIRAANVREIMTARLNIAVSKQCDGVEPDNMDGYTNSSGFALTEADQLAYNRWMANAAHQRGLFVALKNDVDQIRELEPYFDLQVNEQCHEFEECDLLAPFIAAGKPVFNAEYDKSYVENSSDLCNEADTEQIQVLVLPLDLDDSFRITCD